MTEAWPAVNLTEIVRETYREEFEDNVSRFKPDVGPTVDHSRTIMATGPIAFDQWFTTAEFETLETWRRVTLKNGVLPFTRLHPRTGDSSIFKFGDNGFRLVEVQPTHCRVSLNLYRIT
jgi:hypothetical protein